MRLDHDEMVELDEHLGGDGEKDSKSRDGGDGGALLPEKQLVKMPPLSSGKGPKKKDPLLC